MRRTALILLLALCTCAGVPAYAQATRMSNCSQTVSTTSAAVPFPASGSGPAAPVNYLEVCNGHATQTLGVNALGGTAAIGAAGTLTLNPGGCLWWDGPAVPASPSVIGSGAGTTTACWFH